MAWVYVKDVKEKKTSRVPLEKLWNQKQRSTPSLYCLRLQGVKLIFIFSLPAPWPDLKAIKLLCISFEAYGEPALMHSFHKKAPTLQTLLPKLRRPTGSTERPGGQRPTWWGGCHGEKVSEGWRWVELTGRWLSLHSVVQALFINPNPWVHQTETKDDSEDRGGMTTGGSGLVLCGNHKRPWCLLAFLSVWWQIYVTLYRQGTCFRKEKKKSSINRKASTDTQTYLQKDTAKSLLNERGG